MTRLGDNVWGKAAVRLSKVHGDGELFSDLTVRVLLSGEVEAAYRDGDNTRVVPTDTMRNTVYVLAQEHLTADLEAFGRVLANHFLDRDGIASAQVDLTGRSWRRVTSGGFSGASTEQRTAQVTADDDGAATWAGVEGLPVLKTTGSAFRDFPRDELTTLPEKDDRLLATTISGRWLYETMPPDTTATWEQVRGILMDRFFGDWSASVQHQGWQMAEAVLAAVAEIAEISMRLPNQHHLAFDFDRMGVDDHGVVFHPVAEPYGDIRFTATR